MALSRVIDCGKRGAVRAAARRIRPAGSQLFAPVGCGRWSHAGTAPHVSSQLDRRPLSAATQRHAVLRRPDGSAQGDARRRERQLVVDVAAHGFDRSNDRSDRGPADRESCCRADADTYMVRPDYFSTMGIRVLRGRPSVRIRDSERGAPCRDHQPDDGRGVVAGRGSDRPPHSRPRSPKSPLRTIVGIVGGVRHYGLHMPVTNRSTSRMRSLLGRSGS